MFYLAELENVRNEMIAEIENDIKANALYISNRLSEKGKEVYPGKLLEAAKSHDVNWFIESLGMIFFNSKEKFKNGNERRVPSNANTVLCEGEFNRFYIRAVCVKAIGLGEKDVLIYRAKKSATPRPDSVAIEGTLINAEKVLEDLRTNIGIDTALKIPPGPNSGLSVKLNN